MPGEPIKYLLRLVDNNDKANASLNRGQMTTDPCFVRDVKDDHPGNRKTAGLRLSKKMTSEFALYSLAKKKR